jgi:hypothetical protein
MARLTTPLVDQRIEAFRSTLERTTARLVELDADVTRRLLETSQQIRGATATAWADASQRHRALWEGQLALEHLLTRMTEERGPRRSAPQWVLIQLDALLDGASVEVPRPPESGAPRLTEQATPTNACSIADALGQMSADFDVVTGLLATVANAWGELQGRLHELAAGVADQEREIESAGARRPNDLDHLVRDIGNAEDAVREDPISFGPDEIAGLEARAEQVRIVVHEASRERRANEHKLEAAERSIGLGLEQLAACRLQLQAWSDRIVISDATKEALEALAQELERLRLECAQARSLGVGSRAEELSRRGEGLRSEVTRVASLQSTRMERRDELRGLLGAYRAKADALGFAENGEVDALHAAALEALYVAPCDVEEAERYVMDLQRTIGRLQEGPS